MDGAEHLKGLSEGRSGVMTKSYGNMVFLEELPSEYGYQSYLFPLTVFELVTAIFAIDDFELRKDWDVRFTNRTEGGSRVQGRKMDDGGIFTF